MSIHVKPVLNFRGILREWEEERYLRGSLRYALRLGRWASAYAALIAWRVQPSGCAASERQQPHRIIGCDVVMWYSKQILESEHHELLRLMIEAKWIGLQTPNLVPS
jgi:hypothetical protein